MKKITLFLFMLLGALGLHAADIPSGVVAIGSNASSLEAGKWYCLYNNGTKRFAMENGSNALKQTTTTPAGQEASDVLGYLVQLEAVTGGKYYIKTALGNYFKAPSTDARGTGASPASSWAMTIAPISGADGHFTIAGTTYKLTAPTDGSDLKGGTSATANSTGDWSFREVTTSSADDLKGKALYNYQMNKLGFMRLHCRRNMNSWLASSTAGEANCNSKSEDYSTLWYVEKSGSGYTMRSANTGHYLKEGFTETSGTAATLYIRFSPNNTGDDAYVNISSKEEFGNKCLNLMLNGTSITTWTSEGDQGCDWAIELVEDVDMETVRDKINASTGYAKAVTSGKYYRIVNTTRGGNMTDTGDGIRAMNVDPTNFSQLWKVTLTGSDGISFENAFSGKYIQHQNSTSTKYRTGDAATTMSYVSSGDLWEYSWYITNTKGAQQGMHCDNSNNVVLWSTSNPNNKWAFVEVNVTDEEIEEARSNFNVYTDAVANKAAYQAALDKLFADKACTQLQSDIQSLSDDALAANADYAALPQAIKNMVLKVKNNTWTYTTTKSNVTDSYEKFFRIADYQVYSHYQKMSWREYTGQSNAYGKLSGPTSIVLNSGDVAYIYVDQAPSADCTLQVEVVPTEGVPGGHQTGVCTDLQQGFNVIQATEQSLLYIFYQLNDPEKYLANYPNMKVHIEGGHVQGYFDLTRGMVNQDWQNMLDLGMMQHDACPVINLKSKNLVFAMHNQLVKDAIAKAHEQERDAMQDVELLLYVWNKIVETEEYYQGLDELEGRFNNIWNVFSVNYNYMFATTYGTYYHENTLSGCMNYYSNRRFDSDGNGGGPLWGPCHEMGHNHQTTICMVGAMESSNNLFSNIVSHEGGICNTRYDSPASNFDQHLALGHQWNDRGIDVSCRMFTQLYLYFHAQKKDEQFYQKLFKYLRKNPMTKGSWNGSLKAQTNDGEVVGGTEVSGANDYLHFAKAVCDVAEADLSEFFEAYGMFVPEKNHFVGDYANYFVTTTQQDINAAKAYMKKYPKKLGNIMFITDRQERKDADPNNAFKFVPTRADGKRWSASGSGETNGYYGACNGGDYEDYDGHTEYDVDGDYYQISGSIITFKGKGYLGHKVYDLDGNLIWAVNKASATIPSAIKSKFPNEVVVVAAQQNMTDVPCPYYKSGTSPVYKMQVSFADGTSKQWWGKDNIDGYLPENAIAVVGSDNATEALLSSKNVVNKDGSAQDIVINGDAPTYITTPIQAQSITFTKSGSGYQALTLPFAVKNATTLVGNTITPAAVVEAGQPVIIEGAATYTLGNTTIAAGNYPTTATGYVLATDGKSTTSASDITPFTYVWDSAASFDFADGIQQVSSTATTGELYDIAGRKATKLQKGLYIQGNKKVILK